MENNAMKIFENAEFGQIRMVMIDEKPYVCASDVAKALGYSNTRDAISRHCRGVVKRVMGGTNGNKSRRNTCYADGWNVLYSGGRYLQINRKIETS